MSRTGLIRIFLSVTLAALVSACGGGGGGSSSSSPPATSSDWGTMVWDQDNWS
jgi:hypothetical protein